MCRKSTVQTVCVWSLKSEGHLLGFQIPEHVYLDVVGEGVDEFESGDPLVAAHNADVFRVFAV